MAKSTSHKSTSNYTKDLILLFAIPGAIALIAAAIIYIPRLLANPQYDFIYATCDSYVCRDDYSVDSTGKVTKSSESESDNIQYSEIRYFSVDTDSTHSLTLEEAQKYKLNTTSRSPDGYRLERVSSNGGFLFWDSSDEGWYLREGMKKKRVALSNSDAYYSRSIKFIGWVEK